MTLPWPYPHDDTVDMSDHGPIVGLQVLQVRLGQWPSFTGMEYGALQARAVFMATALVREVEDVTTDSSSLNIYIQIHIKQFT